MRDVKQDSDSLQKLMSTTTVIVVVVIVVVVVVVQHVAQPHLGGNIDLKNMHFIIEELAQTFPPIVWAIVIDSHHNSEKILKKNYIKIIKFHFHQSY